MKKTRLSSMKLYSLCNKYQWFTHGDIEQYNRLFWKNDNGGTLEELAIIIWVCSKDADQNEILEILKKECDL